MSPFLSADSAGRASLRLSIARSPSPVTAQKTVRQPKCSPAQAASGTPPTLAMVRPMNMAATALARLSAGTIPAATTEPTPKKAP